MLTAFEFITKTDVRVDPFVLDRFWNHLDKGAPVYLDSDLLSWFGFQGNFWSQIRELRKFLRRNHIVYTEIKTTRASAAAIHVVATRDFKRLVLRLDTARANEVREAFAALEEAFHLYSKYQSQFRIDQLTQELRKLSLAEPCAPAAGSLLLFRLPLDEYNHGGYHFYVVCAGRAGVASAVRRLTTRFPNAQCVLNMVYEAQPRSLLGRIKQRTHLWATFTNNQVRLHDMTEDEFLETIRMTAEGN